jgi:hypothetical protein
MQSDQLIGLIIGGVSVVGGLAIGAVAIIISVPWSFKEKLAKLEASSKERMALIEKGVDPALIMKPKNVIGNDPLFWGLLCVGLGGGSALGVLLSDLTGHKPETYSSSIAVLCTGIALVCYFVYRKRSTDQKPA